MWSWMLPLLAFAEDPVPASVAAPSAVVAPVVAPVVTPSVVAPPAWWTGGCDTAVSVPSDGKLASPAAEACTWEGKGKFVKPKDEPHPGTPCEAWFRSVSGMITGTIVVDELCPGGHKAAIKNFVLAHAWSAPAVHLTVTFVE